MSTDTPTPMSDEQIADAVRAAHVLFAHPEADTTRDIARAIASARDAQWRQRVAELEADARRYACLRDEHIVWKPPKYDGCPHGRFDMVWPNECRDLDAAIDSSLGEEKKA